MPNCPMQRLDPVVQHPTWSASVIMQMPNIGVKEPVHATPSLPFGFRVQNDWCVDTY